MKRFMTISVVFSILMFSLAAHAEMTASGLIEMYDFGTEPVRNHLETVISGNANGAGWVNAFLDEYRGPEHQVYCPPGDFTASGEDVIYMMRATIERNPRFGDLPYGAVVVFTHIDHFPCSE